MERFTSKVYLSRGFSKRRIVLQLIVSTQKIVENTMYSSSIMRHIFVSMTVLSTMIFGAGESNFLNFWSFKNSSQMTEAFASHEENTITQGCSHTLSWEGEGALFFVDNYNSAVGNKKMVLTQNPGVRATGIDISKGPPC